MTSNGVHHVTLLPYHPASNGLAEQAVQVFKESMKHQPTSYSIKSVDLFCIHAYLRATIINGYNLENSGFSEY